MADSTITGLTAAGALAGTEVLPVDQSGSTVKATTQDVANLMVSASNLSSGTLPAARLPAHTGDATSSAGSAALTLATVNSNVGSFTNADITVNAKGLITAAANGSGASSGMSQFSQVITSASATTIVFSSLPTDGSYTNVEIWLTARDVINSAQVSMFLKMNADATAGNYSTAQVAQTSGGAGANTGVASSSSGMFIGNLAGVSGNANAAGSYVISLPNYANTTFHKQAIIKFHELDSASTFTQRSGSIGATWLATTAIDTLTITTAGTNFANGCIATCYLLK